MTINMSGYAAPSVKATLTPYRFLRRDTRGENVIIEILYCGICHFDVHHVRNDYSNTTFPVVADHEIIGRVVSVGSNITRFKSGKEQDARRMGADNMVISTDSGQMDSVSS